jgi:site-specific DNA-adenine methylase
VIEPFAGSARYALEHWDRNVFLYDMDEIVVRVWRYLMQAGEQDVLRLPEPPSKVHIDEYKMLIDEERWLIGFHLCRGKARPRKVGHGQNSWPRDKIRIAQNLHKIRHWQVALGPYTAVPNAPATWYIDPPYQETQVRTNGDRYTHGDGIDYARLAKWCRERHGQVIVCEGNGADWLPFEKLRDVTVNTNNRASKRFTEKVWISEQGGIVSRAVAGVGIW